MKNEGSSESPTIIMAKCVAQKVAQVIYLSEGWWFDRWLNIKYTWARSQPQVAL